MRNLRNVIKAWMKHIKIILIAIAIILTLVQCSKNNDPTPNSSPTDLFNAVWNDFSNWQAAGLDYSLIEDNGIAPDHYVLMDNNSIVEEKDVILEKAIELLNFKKPHDTKKANPGKDWLSVDNRLSSS